MTLNPFHIASPPYESIEFHRRNRTTPASQRLGLDRLGSKRLSAFARRQTSRKGPIDAIADLLSELKCLGIFRALSLGEKFGCLFLRAQERPRLVKKIFTVFGRFCDLQAHSGNDFGGGATAALSAGYSVVLRPDTAEKNLGDRLALSASELE
jgi:hypothetical protein